MERHRERAERKEVPVRSLEKLRRLTENNIHLLLGRTLDASGSPTNLVKASELDFQSIVHYERAMNEFHDKMKRTYVQKGVNTQSTKNGSSKVVHPHSESVFVAASKCFGHVRGRRTKGAVVGFDLPAAAQSPDRKVSRCPQSFCQFCVVVTGNPTTGTFALNFWHDHTCAQNNNSWKNGAGHMRRSTTNLTSEQLAVTVYKQFFGMSNREINRKEVSKALTPMYISRELYDSKVDSVLVHIRKMINGSAGSDLEYLDGYIERLERAGFLVEIDEVTGSEMQEIALQESKVRYAYYRKEQLAKNKQCQKWDEDMEDAKRIKLCELIKIDKPYIMGWSLAYKRVLAKWKKKRWARLALDACHGQGPAKGNFFGGSYLDAQHKTNDLFIHWDMRGEGKRTWKKCSQFLKEVLPDFFEVGNGLDTHPDGSPKVAGVVSDYHTSMPQHGARVHQSVTHGDGAKGITSFFAANEENEEMKIIDTNGNIIENADEVTPASAPQNVAVACSGHLQRAPCAFTGVDAQLFQDARAAKSEEACDTIVDSMTEAGQATVERIGRASLFPGM